MNRYSVYDLEALWPSLHKMYEIIRAFYVTLKGPERIRKQDLKSFLIQEVYTSDSTITKAAQEFVRVSDSRLDMFEHGKKLPEYPRVFAAVVALNGVYTATKKDDGLEDVLYFMYLNGYFIDIARYLRELHENDANTNTNTNSQRTVSVGSITNASSQVSTALSTAPVERATAALNSVNANNEGAFGPMNAGARRNRSNRRKRNKTQKIRKTRK